MRTIVGAARCIEHSGGCDLARGIETDDDAGTVTFHLRRADPEFLYKLALPFAFPVPPGTRSGDIGFEPVPATGPYMIASASRKRIELVRNPRFHEWSRAAKPDGYPDTVVALFGVTAAKRVTMVKGGAGDIATEVGAAERLVPDLQARFPDRLRFSSSPQTAFIFLNTKLSPFDRPGVRRAVNLALDRDELVRLAGGRAAVQPTCQILPPGFPGYSPYCPYANVSPDGSIGHPKFAEARRLVARSGTRGMRIDVWSDDGWSRELPYVVSVLRRLGYDARGHLDANADKHRANIQVGFFVWFADYPSLGGYIEPLIACHSPSNLSGFCDPAIDRRIRQAFELQARDLGAAYALWSEIDRRIVDQAPIVPTYNPRSADFVSKRVGNYQFHPIWGRLFDQMWVR